MTKNAATSGKASILRREAARTTIVGGQPEGNARDLPPIPVGLEHLMGLAAASPEFADALAQDRKATVEATGLDFSASERAILASVPAPALDQMISRVKGRLDAPDRRRFLEQASLALAALLGASAAAGCKKKPSQESSDKSGGSPDKDQPGTPEAEGDRPAREVEPPPPEAKADAAAPRPADPPPERPEASPPARPGAGERPAGADTKEMDADSMDMAAMEEPESMRPASVAPQRERPAQPPPTKGIQPWRPKPRFKQPVQTRGISPDRNFMDD
ncbi:MAG: hypothetical protein RBU30_00065 [Polyangia bacterium]|nr:hypothetical protein [Polyangia bacterium]